MNCDGVSMYVSGVMKGRRRLYTQQGQIVVFEILIIIIIAGFFSFSCFGGGILLKFTYYICH